MVKGDDALRRKRNKVIRKRLRNSDSSVSARIAAVIASKRRRKAGKRRACEGMCYSLPTEDDPFNERFEKKAMVKNKESKKKKLEKSCIKLCSTDRVLNADEKEKLLKKPIVKPEINGSSEISSSKFLMLCLESVEDAWVKEGSFDKGMGGSLLSKSWGRDFYLLCSAGSSVVINEAFATRAQVAWIISTAAHIIAVKEKQGIVVASPFLLFLVSSEDRAVEVRSLCKPLKPLGVHTICLHPGTSLDHQIFGLKNCKPEFIVSTPERLLELVSLNAVDISGTSLMVLDGLTKFEDLGLLDNLKSIREGIFGDPQIISFSESYEASITTLLMHLIRGSYSWLSGEKSVSNPSTSVSQYIHFCTSDEEKFSEVIQILDEAFSNQTVQSPKVLLISGSECKIDALVSYLNSRGYAIGDDSHKGVLHKTINEKSGTVMVKDIHSLIDLELNKFEIVVIVDFPSTIDDYLIIPTLIARHTPAGVLHSFFSTVDAPLAQSLINALIQYGQKVPKFLRSFSSSKSTS